MRTLAGIRLWLVLVGATTPLFWQACTPAFTSCEDTRSCSSPDQSGGAAGSPDEVELAGQGGGEGDAVAEGGSSSVGNGSGG